MSGGKHPYWGSSLHYSQCLTGPMMSSAVFGTLFAGMDVMQGARFTPSRAGFYILGVYAFNAFQCPMEAIHGRQSLLHNGLSAGILGYAGVSGGYLGVPFLDHSVFWRYPWLRMEMAAFGIYGTIAMALGALGGKQL
eukprot:CAMPEP_0197448770 /NCGR_PEP_ID=MMETSP1175-20131217/18911_1 /TAXON_ID=1003142 /ORGANISM="Triceratium dubium, Strain CCMP147" /LENGTH=136 /DNA_ID=CAMNT_0042980663 /DNA_START=26 /DNA_END=436 /DNA_ORIENTATION=+